MDTSQLTELLPSTVEPMYRKNRPKDRALVLVVAQGSDSNRVIVLDWIGPALRWFHENTSLQQKFGFYDFDDFPPGLWIWEGQGKEEGYVEPEFVLDGDIRSLTPEELEALEDSLGGEGPWDTKLWIENADQLY